MFSTPRPSMRLPSHLLMTSVNIKHNKIHGLWTRGLHVANHSFCATHETLLCFMASSQDLLIIGPTITKREVSRNFSDGFKKNVSEQIVPIVFRCFGTSCLGLNKIEEMLRIIVGTAATIGPLTTSPPTTGPPTTGPSTTGPPTSCPLLNKSWQLVHW